MAVPDFRWRPGQGNQAQGLHISVVGFPGAGTVGQGRRPCFVWDTGWAQSSETHPPIPMHLGRLASHDPSTVT